jgi:hypothetical protein
MRAKLAQANYHLQLIFSRGAVNKENRRSSDTALLEEVCVQGHARSCASRASEEAAPDFGTIVDVPDEQFDISFARNLLLSGGILEKVKESCDSCLCLFAVMFPCLRFGF